MRVSPIDIVAGMFVGGQFTPFHGLARVYDRAEFRTNLTPTISIDVASLDGDGSPDDSSLFLKLLQPTLVLSGPEGTKVIAPEGEASESGGLFGLVTLFGLASVPFFLGVAYGRSRRRQR